MLVHKGTDLPPTVIIETIPIDFKRVLIKGKTWILSNVSFLSVDESCTTFWGQAVIHLVTLNKLYSTRNSSDLNGTVYMTSPLTSTALASEGKFVQREHNL